MIRQFCSSCFSFLSGSQYYYCEFLTPVLADGLSLGLSDGKSPQVPRTLLSILVDLNIAVVWMLSVRPPIFNSSSPLPITTGITVTFLFHRFFSTLARSKYLSLFSFSFIFIRYSAGTRKTTIWQVLFFLNDLMVWSSGWD